MKIAFTSDLHVDISENNTKILPYLVDHVNSIKPDLFIVAGDLANKLSEMETAFNILSQINSKKIFVPGNHDVWIESKNQLRSGKDSFYKFNIAIRELCKKYQFIYPVDMIHYQENAAILGSIGWYDYSLRDERLDNAYSNFDYNQGEFGSQVWNDAKNAIWLRYPKSENWKLRSAKLSNSEIFNYFFNKFAAQFETIPSSIENIISIIHTAPFKECITPKEEPSPFDAYEGSIKYGEFIENNSIGKSIKVICGHRHSKFYQKRGNIEIFRSPVGYLDRNINDLNSIINEFIETIIV